jgi:signal transduction histidine kinase/DNA-binding response OmpR family regulator
MLHPPVYVDPGQDDARAPYPVSSKAPAAVDARRPLVWIVDDSPLELEMARRALSAAYDIETFPEGAPMLERLASTPGPDALVLDCQLPGMSGIDVCRFLRGTLDEIALPVVMLTVQGHKQDVVEGLAAGANDYVTKPYDAAELLARVGTLSRTKRLYERARRAEKALEVERDHLDLLARAGTALYTSLDVVSRCESIARLIVPALADACGVYMCQQDGALALVAGSTADAGRAGILGDLTRITQLVLGSSTGEGPQAIRPVFVPDVSGMLAMALTDATPSDAAPLAALRDAGVTAYILAPLALQDRAVGCLALAITDSSRRYDEPHFALAQELGRRTAGAADNARLFEMTQVERARADEANRAKDEFLAIVSHELRSPLTAILGWASLLSAGDLNADDRTRAVQIIERNARSQTQLIADLLNISSILSGKLRLDVTRIQPGTIVEGGLETIRPTADAKGVRLEALVDAEAGLIQGDPERLQQIVWNLLTNAVKFTPKGGRVEARVQRVGAEVEVVVTDSGCGIPAEFLPHVFERFRQAETGVARQHAGLGLGLAITRHLVELHGGTIQATSPGPGLGATFAVRFPLAPQGVAPSAPVEGRKQGGSAAPLVCPPELEGLRVLLVDDEADVRTFLGAALRRCKAEVTAVATVADAMSAVRAAPPDILLSDIGMPGNSGYDLIRMIRNLPPEQGGRTPAVALTGYSRLDDRTRALMMGFDMHITKPIDPAELLVVLARFASRIQRS